MRFRRIFLILLRVGPLWASILLLRAAVQGPLVSTVPFVGCESDGQVVVPPPRTPDRVIRLDANTAARLAYYKAALGPGVLGPRGWNCFEIIGSSGTNLLVTPGALSRATLFPSAGGVVGIAGTAIQLAEKHGDTSGRYIVAQVVARVFPARRDFARGVIAGGELPASDFPFGPYPVDRLVYRGDRIVEYETPPHAQGLGTLPGIGLEQNNDPIRGIAMLKNPTPDLWFLTIRLAPNMRDLESTILRQVEDEP